jgi:hypothetical protein
MSIFDRKPGRPSNTERLVRGVAEGVTESVVKSNEVGRRVDERVKQHTGKDIADRAGSLVRDISSRLK